MKNETISIGDLVRTANLPESAENYDEGRVLEIIDAERVMVGWQSGVTTPAFVTELEAR